MSKQVIVGLGCSWTQGEGGYPVEVWKDYGGRVNIPLEKDAHLRKYEHLNSWVNVLCKKYFTDHTPVNLGRRGIGNRAAVKQLYMSGITVDWENDSGYIVLMLSGLERFDFFSNNYRGFYKHMTMWPNPDHGSQLWTGYAKEIYGDVNCCLETWAAIRELETFVKAHPRFKLVIANAFYPMHIPDYFKEHIPEYQPLIDWSRYAMTADKPNYVLQLVEADGLMNHTQTHYYNYYKSLDYPAKYLTNCIHPTIDGYKFIAADLADFIKKRYS